VCSSKIYLEQVQLISRCYPHYVFKQRPKSAAYGHDMEPHRGGVARCLWCGIIHASTVILLQRFEFFSRGICMKTPDKNHLKTIAIMAMTVVRP
jgi:hypothetical protein